MVIRNEGPQGGPGMREMLYPSNALVGAGLGDDVALITDGRFSGFYHLSISSLLNLLRSLLLSSSPSSPLFSSLSPVLSLSPRSLLLSLPSFSSPSLPLFSPSSPSPLFSSPYSFIGATHGIMIGHVTPEAYAGGPLAIVEVYLPAPSLLPPCPLPAPSLPPPCSLPAPLSLSSWFIFSVFMCLLILQIRKATTSSLT